MFITLSILEITSIYCNLMVCLCISFVRILCKRNWMRRCLIIFQCREGVFHLVTVSLFWYGCAFTLRVAHLRGKWASDAQGRNYSRCDNWEGMCIFIYSCSARQIYFESDCFNVMWTWIYEYIPPPPPPPPNYSKHEALGRFSVTGWLWQWQKT
jgi:hypothetical protein